MTKWSTYLFLIPLLMSLAASGQTALHIPFGQSLPEVQTFIDSRDYIFHAETSANQDTLTAKIGRKEAQYIFKEGVLYEITTSTLYQDKKKGEERYKSCVDFFKLRRSDIKNVSAGAAGKGIVAIEESQIAQVQSIPDKDAETIRVEMTITSRRHGPRMQTEEFARTAGR